MDVAMVREVERTAPPATAAVPVRRREQPASEAAASRRAAARHGGPERTFDPAEGVAERLGAGVDKLQAESHAATADPPSQELWIPAWVRSTYASRARKGWFMPAPQALAGYSDET